MEEGVPKGVEPINDIGTRCKAKYTEDGKAVGRNHILTKSLVVSSLVITRM